MKIGFVIGSNTYRTSLYTATIDTVESMREKGHKVDYIFLAKHETLRGNDKIVDIWGLSKESLSSRIFIKVMKTIFGYHFFHTIFSRLFSSKLETFARNDGYDLLFFHGTNFIPFSKYSRPYYAVLHSCKYSNLVERYSGLKKAFYHALFRSIFSHKRLLCVSQSVKQDMLELMGAKPTSIDVVYNGFNFDGMRKKAQAGHSETLPEKFMMAAGRPDRTKRFDVLLKAYALAKENQSYDLVIFGEGRRLADLQQLARSLGISDKVHFKGFVTPLIPIFPKASLYVLSSDIEGLPTVIIESLIVGTPVVATEAGGVKELLAGGGGYLCKKGDHKALAALIDKALRGEMNIPQNVLAFLSADKVAESYIKHAKQLIG